MSLLYVLALSKRRACNSTNGSLIFFQHTMNESLKVLLFVAMVLPSILKGEVLRPYHNKHALNQAFKNCTNKVCVSRVSFCIIMKDCGCGAQPREFCGCCEDCYRCLGSNLWRKCCDCVGLCGFVSLNSTGNGLGIPSKFGELSGQSLPTLFEALSQNTTHLMPVMFMTRPRKGGLKKHGKFEFLNDCLLIVFPFNSSLQLVQHKSVPDSLSLKHIAP